MYLGFSFLGYSINTICSTYAVIGETHMAKQTSFKNKVYYKKDDGESAYMAIGEGSNGEHTIHVQARKSWEPDEWVALATENQLKSANAGIEFTGGFAGKLLSNNFAWQPGTGISITQADVGSGIYKTFSLDRDVHLAVDVPYWSDPVPADHTDKGVFGGSYLPDNVPTVFDYVTVDPDTYEDGSNVVTTGGLDMSNFKVGDTIRARFDFNAIPQISNTTIEPAIWYKNRDSNNNVTFTFPLTSQPIFFGTGTVGKTLLNRVDISVYIASQEDINALAQFSIKSDNQIIIQPLSCLLTLIR